MKYVFGDIHNDLERFNKMLGRISFHPQEDMLYLVGDVFDRAEYHPQPFGLYMRIRDLGDCCISVRGNHDQWLSEYIDRYLENHEEIMGGMPAFYYNTFQLLKNRVSDAKLREISDWIQSCPLQVEVKAGDSQFLIAHAMTSPPEEHKPDGYFLMGDQLDAVYLNEGINGYISICGHNFTSYIRKMTGDRHRPEKQEIWTNAKGNLFMIDCGCGFSASENRLGCVCLDTLEKVYVD